MRNLLYTLLLFSIAAAGCGSTSHHYRSASYAHSNVRYLSDDGASQAGQTSTPKEVSRKMIYSANVTIVSSHPDTVGARVAAIAKKYEGYVLETGSYSTTIRVKSSSLNDALKDIETLGKVKSKSMSGTDVTDEFTDYNIRLENAERARKRYLELLDKAANVDETLKVEKELERLNGEIDLLKGKMNRIDHLVDYSTIIVYHEERTKLGVLGYVVVGLYDAVKWLFVRN